MIYKENNVFDEALERIRMLFDTHDDIIVSMSGGKDSTVVFNLALMVAKEKNRLPLKVFCVVSEKIISDNLNLIQFREVNNGKAENRN